MTSGIATLAPLGELAVIFNFAYSELKNTRYVSKIDEKIRILKSQAQSIDVFSDPGLRSQAVAIMDRVDEMISDGKVKRKKAWLSRSGKDDATHNDFYAGGFYEFFWSGKDKIISTIAYIGAVFFVASAVAIGHFSGESDRVFWCSANSWWDTLFVFFVILNIVPLIFVILGRRMVFVATRCIDYATEEYKEVSDKQMNETI